MATNSTPDFIDPARFGLLHKMLGDPLRTLLDKYISDCTSALDHLSDCISTNNLTDGIATTHRMKGASASIGAPRMRDWFTDMENTMRHRGSHANDWHTEATELLEQTRLAAQAVFNHE